jgi:hypothetical protein
VSAPVSSLTFDYVLITEGLKSYKAGGEGLRVSLGLQPAGDGFALSDALSLGGGVLKVAETGTVAL